MALAVQLYKCNGDNRQNWMTPPNSVRFIAGCSILLLNPADMSSAAKDRDTRLVRHLHRRYFEARMDALISSHLALTHVMPLIYHLPKARDWTQE